MLLEERTHQQSYPPGSPACYKTVPPDKVYLLVLLWRECYGDNRFDLRPDPQEDDSYPVL